MKTARLMDMLHKNVGSSLELLTKIYGRLRIILTNCELTVILNIENKKSWVVTGRQAKPNSTKGVWLLAEFGLFFTEGTKLEGT